MKSTRVLIVDDEPGIRESLLGVLEDEGYTCAAAETGEQALEELARNSYDIVLLDVWLPGIDGLETLSRIQELPAVDRPEVVVISGHGTIETAVRATKSGAFDFLEKPLGRDRVLVAVKNALEQTPPELGADIAERGMMLTGGGALLRDLDRLLAEETGLPVLVAEDPLTCVVRGCGMALERMERLGSIFTSE